MGGLAMVKSSSSPMGTGGKADAVGYDIFVLVWGEPFVRNFIRYSLPTQLARGNIPALSQQADVTYHIYTDRESDPAFRPGITPLSSFATIKFHYFDELEIGGATVTQHTKGLLGPDYKYQTQRLCMRHLFDSVGDDENRAYIFLDSNFLLSEDVLSAAHRRRIEGWKAVSINALRISQERMITAFGGEGKPLSSRALVKFSLKNFHRLGSDSFVDSGSFSPYPSQIFWRVGAEGIAARSFLPHPLMVCNSPAIANFQSTMDYDLVLRAWGDAEVMIIGDSDEAVISKFSADEHAGERQPGPAPTPQNLALFILTSTNWRHQRFASMPIRFHAGDIDQEWAAVEETIKTVIDESYAEIDRIAGNAGKLDARFMMYLKSYLGPIEDFTSPQLEPAALSLMSAPALGETRI